MHISTRDLPKKNIDMLVKENDYRETIILQKIGLAKYSVIIKSFKVPTDFDLKLL